MKKKLIEVALPLEKINAESAREKSIRFGHPSTLHLWWARRPLATTRAIIWSSLVDDPSSHPELFPTEEDQDKERRRLFKILEKLVIWENINDKKVLDDAKDEILKSTDYNPPELLDCFAGGGAIPLEGQRLGLKVNAHDLNPIPIMINKAMVEIPPLFANEKPVNPKARETLSSKNSRSGTQGIADDVRYYGQWMRKEAISLIGSHYPKVKTNQTSSGEANVIAWVWARTVKCPNPVCRCHMPLASSFILSKKKGQEAWVEAIENGDHFEYKVRYGLCPKDKESAKVGKGGAFKCIKCGAHTSQKYVTDEFKAGRNGEDLLAVVAEGDNTRIFVSPTVEQREAARISKPDSYPDGPLPDAPRYISPPLYGLTKYSQLFTNRQLTALTTYANLISLARKKIEQDAIAAGMSNDHRGLADGGTGAKAYSEAIGIFLSFGISRMANSNNSLCIWTTVKTQVIPMYSRQAIPMVWDYAENNVFNNAAGDLAVALDNVARVIEKYPQDVLPGAVKQFDAQNDCNLREMMISTDPPYYDNIGYADLSDFFYVWMRHSQKDVFPELFSTLMSPKVNELIATPYRHDGDMVAAKEFFEDGMIKVCKQIYKYTRDDIPVTIYYAYKQSDNDGLTSSGWETMLSSIIRSGFIITGTWPVRTELVVALKARVNALASSIVLVCRKRPLNAPACTRRNFINELKRRLRPALQKLQSSNIAPVDLAQSAIGPGMSVFSKYAQVLEADGTPMTVRSALKAINQELDLYFNEQDSDLDSESRFCVDLYSQFAFNEMPFGDANTLATAKNTSVAIMASHGILYAQKGKVHLIERPELPENIKDREGDIWLLCQQLTYKMEKEGVEGCAKVLAYMFGSNGERAKDLAYRLYTIAERKKWSHEAYAYNALVVAWPEIQSRAAELKAIEPEQMTIFDILPN